MAHALGFLTRFAAMAALTACGGSGDDADSCNAGACGGDLLGKWQLTGGCFVVLQQPELEFCPSATAELHLDKSSGTLVFDKDTYSRDFDLTSRLMLSVPEKCKHTQDTEYDCADLSTTLSSGNTLECKDASGGSCSCEATYGSKQMDSGIYTKKGNQVQLVPGLTDYCVSGSAMTVRPVISMSMGKMGEMTSILQATLQKQ
jgi:hypothetical protein